MEKMIALSRILDVTLDYLVSENDTADGATVKTPDQKIRHRVRFLLL